MSVTWPSRNTSDTPGLLIQSEHDLKSACILLSPVSERLSESLPLLSVVGGGERHDDHVSGLTGDAGPQQERDVSLVQDAESLRLQVIDALQLPTDLGLSDLRFGIENILEAHDHLNGHKYHQGIPPVKLPKFFVHFDVWFLSSCFLEKGKIVYNMIDILNSKTSQQSVSDVQH